MVSTKLLMDMVCRPPPPSPAIRWVWAFSRDPHERAPQRNGSQCLFAGSSLALQHCDLPSCGNSERVYTLKKLGMQGARHLLLHLIKLISV